jgi:O-antigen/teichoic acid export membrane protein
MYRDLLTKTGTYSIAYLAIRLASFVMLPVYTRFLSPADYGVMELLDLTTTVIGLLFGTRVGAALFYYYFSATTQSEKDRCLANVFIFSIALGLAIAGVTVPAAGFISSAVFGTSQYALYFRLLFIGFACSLPVEVGYSCIRAFNKPGLYVRLTVIQSIIGALLNVVLLTGLHMGISSMLISSITTSAGLALFMAWYALSPITISISLSRILQIFRYCVPLGLSGLAVFLIHYGDRIFLRSAVSLSELGVYALAYKLGMLIACVHAPFHLYWTSQVCDIVRMPGGERLYARTTTALVAVLTFATLVLVLFSEPIVKVFAGPAFVSASGLVPWLGCAYLIRAVGSHIQCVFTIEGRPGLEMKVNALGSLACFAGYATLIPLFGLWGAVAATLLGFVVILCYGHWEAQRLRKFPFEYRQLLTILLVGASVAAAFYILGPASPWQRVMIAVSCAAIYCISVFSLCLDSEERLNVLTAARGFFKRQLTPDAASTPV